MKIDLWKGDCLELMKDIPDKSVDMVLTDPPYGTTACKWDNVIPFEPMWEQLHRVTKDNGAICLFGSEPFSSALRMSNIKRFKYDWVWKKNRGSNFGSVKYQPMKEHELISVFSTRSHKYYPIKQLRSEGGRSRVQYDINPSNTGKRDYLGGFENKVTRKKTELNDMRVPSSVQFFNTEVGHHPTQKPVALLEYLIKTYTLEGETVLDFTMGSGSTGVACVNLDRNFIGIEQDEDYSQIAENRIEFARETGKTLGPL